MCSGGPRVTPSRAAHILLVEDHADTAEAVADFLRGSGHRVTLARSVGEALSRVMAAQEAGRPFDLVVSDLGLPDGSGLDLMPELKRVRSPGIALSGFGMEGTYGGAGRPVSSCASRSRSLPDAGRGDERVGGDRR